MLDALRRRLLPTNARFSIIASTFAASAFLIPATQAVAGGWTVVFADNFNQTSLDMSAWHTRFIHNGGTLDHFNDELQRYRENGNHVLQS